MGEKVTVTLNDVSLTLLNERATLLRAFDDLVPRIPVRSAAETDTEITSIRSSRRAGGRATAHEE